MIDIGNYSGGIERANQIAVDRMTSARPILKGVPRLAGGSSGD